MAIHLLCRGENAAKDVAQERVERATVRLPTGQYAYRWTFVTAIVHAALAYTWPAGPSLTDVRASSGSTLEQRAHSAESGAISSPVPSILDSWWARKRDIPSAHDLDHWILSSDRACWRSYRPTPSDSPAAYRAGRGASARGSALRSGQSSPGGSAPPAPRPPACQRAACAARRSCPRNRARSPYSRLTSAGSIEAGWIGLSTSRPISISSGMMGCSIPSQ